MTFVCAVRVDRLFTDFCYVSIEFVIEGRLSRVMERMRTESIVIGMIFVELCLESVFHRVNLVLDSTVFFVSQNVISD